MFEQAMIESAKKRKNTRRWWIFGTAIGIHVVLGSVASFASFWNVEDLPEPAIQVSFVSAPPPPPPPAPPKGRPKRPKPAQVVRPKVVPSLQPVQPVIIPENIPAPDTPDLPDMPDIEFDDTGVDGGVEGGVEGGVPGGVVGGMGEPDAPIRVEGNVTQPEIIKRVEPRYTEMARRARISGVVIVEAIIDKQGNVTNARILRGLGGGLNEEAIEAVEKWQFKPATLNGRPVTVYFTLTITFKIK
jgi:periplasmic protein TonB